MTYRAKLNRAANHAPIIRWHCPKAQRIANIKAKAKANNLRDGRAVFLLG